MAKTNYIVGCLFLLLVCSCRDFKNAYKVDPVTRGQNVIVDTIITDLTLIVPEIPAKDSAARLSDDPPPTYQAPREETIDEVQVVTKRDVVRKSYLTQIGVRELTGKNDGPRVEQYLRSTGLGKGYAWCAAFVKWNFDQGGVYTNITAWAPTAHNPVRLIWFQNKQTGNILPADVFTLWYASKKRIAHTGFVDEDSGNGFLETVEGNTNGGGSRDGDGVYKRKRLKKTLYSVSRWIKD